MAFGRLKAKREAKKAREALQQANQRFTEEMASMKRQNEQAQSYAYQKDAIALAQQKKSAADAEAARLSEELSKNAVMPSVQRANEKAESVNSSAQTAPAPAETPQQAKIAALGGGAGAATAPTVMAKKEDAKPVPTLNAFTMPSTKNVQFGGS